ncbi:MAG TPA: PDZ domain-containing protein [Phycisphaerae bacterium]|nr:PDZ domain-containing protein [Phycisphaerae bacterium]
MAMRVNARVATVVVMAAALAGAGFGQSLRIDPARTKGGEALRVAFRSVVEGANKSTVAIRADVAAERPGRGAVGRRRPMQVALGTIITGDGYILTKASEVMDQEDLRIIINNRSVAPKIVGVSQQHDLAMLKVDIGSGPKLTPVVWAEGTIRPDIGEWVATAGPAGWAQAMGGSTVEEPLAVGVVSVGRRRIPGRNGFLGVALDDAPNNGGAVITQVIPNSAAEKAQLKVDDVITDVNGKAIHNRADLILMVRGFRPGDTVTLGVRRGGEKFHPRATLGTNAAADPEEFSMETMLGGPVSKRASDFPVVFEHDTVITPAECGGPVVDLSGKVIGINIARAGRTETYALPADVIVPLLDPLESGKLAPVGANNPDAATKPGEKVTTLPGAGE